MDKRWIICAAIAAAAASLTACGGESITAEIGETASFCESTQCPEGTVCNEELKMCVSIPKGDGKPDPCDECTAEQECINNVCVDKEPEPEVDPCDQCTENQKCVEGTCVDKDPDPPIQLCSDTEKPKCNGNAVVTCVEGNYVPKDCDDKECKNGKCVDKVDPNKCDPQTFKNLCEQNSVVSCVEGMLHSEFCPEGQYCEGGSCFDTDYCPDNPEKMAPGVCGCAMPDTDLDENGTVDCLEIEDLCPDDPEKTNPGQCGCGIPETTCDDVVLCTENENKTVPGVCGCDADDIDSDGDGILDCIDKCPNNAYKFLEDECDCEHVQVSIDDTKYCAVPVGTAQEFIDIVNGIADESLEVTADSVYALMRDINLANGLADDTEWKPVTFKGKLTSGGNTAKTIAYTNAEGERNALKCGDTAETCGLFGTLSGARIHNIKLNLGVSGHKKLGGLAGTADTSAKLTSIDAMTDITGAGNFVGGVIGQGSKITLSAITHQGKIINIGANTSADPISDTGGIAGRLTASTISKSQNKGRVVSESENTDSPANYLGGIVGYTTSGTTLSDLTNDSIVSSQTSNYVGGISGYTVVSASGNTNLINNGYVKGYQRIGGLFGQIDNSSGAEGITRSVNNGTVAGLWTYTGGIGGIASTPLKYCINHGTVSGSTYVGGIAGQLGNNTDHIFNDGTVWSENAQQGCSTNLGGIAGYIVGGYKHSYLTNLGKVVADWAPRMAVNSSTGVQAADDCPNQHYGGITGWVYGGGTTMEYIYNGGDLSTSSSGLRSCGGIAGWAHTVAITNAKNVGNIKGNTCVGGIFGRFGYRGTSASKKIPFLVKNVENTGNILASSSAVGGIIGSIDIDDEKAEFTIDTAVNSGNISSTSSTLGGIFGIIYVNDLNNNYKNLYNTGTLKGVSNIGGIVGQFVGANTSDHWDTENPRFYSTGPRTMTNSFDTCVSTGNITASGGSIGGLFGTVSVPAVAPYATTSGNTYKTVYCNNNSSIYHREIDIKYYNVSSIFNLQNSYFSGNLTETGTSTWFGGLFGYLDTRSSTPTYTNTIQVYDNDCTRTKQNTTSYTVTSLAQTNVKNCYVLGTISSDHERTAMLFGRLLSQDSVAKTNEYKTSILNGKDAISTLSNVYSAASVANNGSAVSGYNDNKSFLTVSDVYTWAGGNPKNLVWGGATSLDGYTSFNFNDAGTAVIGSNKLIDKLNASAGGLTAWKEGSYTLPDNKSVKVPTFDSKPQLETWEPWDGKL